MINSKKLSPEDIKSLLEYFKGLSEETKAYFAPHPFDADTIKSICYG